MTETAESLFEQGIERYKAGATASELIPVFKDVCDRAPKSSPALTCLAWLYLLEEKPNAALKTAQKSRQTDASRSAGASQSGFSHVGNRQERRPRPH